MSDKDVPEQYWTLMKNHLDYTDEEAELFRKDPRNKKVLLTAPKMGQKTIVFEVVESKGCNSHHSVGTRFFFTGDGNLITKMAPSRICAYAFPVMTQALFALQELMYAGVDPNEICFRRASCFDVGIQCGGWGQIVVEAKVMDRDEAKKVYESQSK